jgi:hypothetical protein
MERSLATDQAILNVRDRLRDEFSTRVDPVDVDRVVNACAEDFRDAPIITFVPVLVEKAARQQLRLHLQHVLS